MFSKSRKIKFFSWEYWPTIWVYIPVIIQYFYNSARFRHFFFPTIANPGIKNSGLFGESKWELLSTLPIDVIPETLFVKEGTRIETLIEELNNTNIHYPFIAKPDIGERGNGVRIIRNCFELEKYGEVLKGDYLLQEYIDLPLEFGILCHKSPTGKVEVTSIVQKQFLTVVGDGRSTVLDLLTHSERGYLQIERVANVYPQLATSVPAKGKEVVVESIGNHSRGTAFLDAGHLINETTTAFAEWMFTLMKEIYLCRIDLRCAGASSLAPGGEFKILEVNGIASEPGHIYQPGYSYIKGMKHLLLHWDNVYQLAKYNQGRGYRCTSFSILHKDWTSYLALMEERVVRNLNFSRLSENN